MSTHQTPLHSGFGAATTAEEVIQGIDLTGKVAVVTGGYSGLGLETVRVLRDAGTRVIVPTRDVPRAAQALQGIDIEIEAMDLLDPVSIDAFASKFIESKAPLHILINSAGIMANPLTRDVRGFESQFATNHLGHFQLAARLWPALVRAKGARVVSVSSRGHYFSPLVPDDPNYQHREYDRWKAYGQSKTANILFAVELDKRGQAHGVRAFAAHPGGIVGTGLDKHISKQELEQAGVIDENGQPILDPNRNLKTVQQGAATQIWCAVSPQLDGKGGVYCENVEISPLDMAAPKKDRQLGETGESIGVMAYAVNPETAAQLWSLSEELLGLKFSAGE